MADWAPAPKPGHDDQTVRHGPSVGPMRHLVVRHDGTPMGSYQSRHDAVGAIARTVHNLNGANDFDVLHVPAGEVPTAELRWYNG